MTGCPEDDEACEFDSDCSDGLICVDEVCTETCDTSEDCSDDEVCAPRPGDGEGQICVPGEGPECTEDDECEGDLVCDQGTNTCIEADPDPFFTVEIRDDSPEERCGDTSYTFASPGAKIMYVALMDVEGNVLAWGEGVGANLLPAERDTYVDWEATLDGTEPELGTDQCLAPIELERPDTGAIVNTGFHPDQAFSLGCGGSVFVQFRDSEGNRIALDDSHEIRVGEYGPSCNAAFSEDLYRVFLCEGTDEEVSDNEACTTELTTDALTGIDTVGVSLPADEE